MIFRVYMRGFVFNYDLSVLVCLISLFIFPYIIFVVFSLYLLKKK